jgi:hypothetical protein
MRSYHLRNRDIDQLVQGYTLGFRKVLCGLH